MEYGLYAIQDTMIGFNAPFVMVNDDVAIREYKNFLESTKNASDMRLYKLGTFNDHNGVIDVEMPELLEGGL